MLSDCKSCLCVCITITIWEFTGLARRINSHFFISHNSWLFFGCFYWRNISPSLIFCCKKDIGKNAQNIYPMRERNVSSVIRHLNTECTKLHLWIFSPNQFVFQHEVASSQKCRRYCDSTFQKSIFNPSNVICLLWKWWFEEVNWEKS